MPEAELTSTSRSLEAFSIRPRPFMKSGFSSTTVAASLCFRGSRQVWFAFVQHVRAQSLSAFCPILSSEAIKSSMEQVIDVNYPHQVNYVVPTRSKSFCTSRIDSARPKLPTYCVRTSTFKCMGGLGAWKAATFPFTYVPAV